MKSFCYSLIVFILLFCSCKTQKSARLINNAMKERLGVLYESKKSLSDTSSVKRLFTDNLKLRFVGTIKITEYDSNTGKPIKETNAEGEFTQDSDKALAEEAQNGVTEALQDSLNLFREATKKVDSKEMQESQSDSNKFFIQLGKSIGIILGSALVIGIFGRYLLQKYKVN